MTPARRHGGPDGGGPIRHDFSTCANALGPCPAALDALRRADPTRYPDPSGRALHLRLAQFHGVAPRRILLAASASEFIQRITAVGARLLPGAVQRPRHAYGDYAAAARAWGRACVIADDPDSGAPGGPPVSLCWFGDPSSPLGQDAGPPARPGARPGVLDAVYAPLRLEGRGGWSEAEQDTVFVLHSPNKALGLVGVRGAYAVAPSRAGWDVEAWCAALEAAAPSWPLSAQAEAMLGAWTTPAVQRWIAASRPTLAGWHAAGLAGLRARGFEARPSVTPFACVRPPPHAGAAAPGSPHPAPPAASPWVAALRRQGIAVRDTASFGLPGEWRISAQAPGAQAALFAAIDRLLDAAPAPASRAAP